MGNEGTTAQLPGWSGVTARGRPGLVTAIVRAILALGWLAILLNGLTEAREASLDELRRDLAEGSVSAIQVERADTDARARGTFGLRWDAGLFDSFLRYEYDSAAGVDEAAALLEQARAQGVPVRVVPAGRYPVHDIVSQNGWLITTFGPSAVAVGLLVALASLLMLITSPRPWLATKWAWFWLLWAIPLLWLAFLIVEPRPLRRSLRLARAGRVPQPLLVDRDRRLTGGWALIIAWIASAILASTGVPLLSAWQ